MGKVYLEVVTPEKVLVSQETESVVAPGSLGEFGVLEGHVPFLTGLVPGELRYTAAGKTHYFAVTAGFVEVSNNRVSVLVDAAESATEIDLDRARKAMERARERLEKARGTQDVDFARAEAALRRAIARIRLAKSEYNREDVRAGKSKRGKQDCLPFLLTFGSTGGSMKLFALDREEPMISGDDIDQFQLLEEKVERLIGVVRTLRKENQSLSEKVRYQEGQMAELNGQLEGLRITRDRAREKIVSLMEKIDKADI